MCVGIDLLQASNDLLVLKQAFTIHTLLCAKKQSIDKLHYRCGEWVNAEQTITCPPLIFFHNFDDVR